MVLQSMVVLLVDSSALLQLLDSTASASFEEVCEYQLLQENDLVRGQQTVVIIR